MTSFGSGTLSDTSQGAVVTSDGKPQLIVGGESAIHWHTASLPHLSPTQSRVTKPYFDIHGLPPEIRVLVFRQCLLAWRSRVTPRLIKALRGDPELYYEALEEFYLVKTCSISSKNKDTVKWMPQSVLKRVTSLRVLYTMEMRKTEWEFDFTIHLPESSLRHYANLTLLRITTNVSFLKEREGLNELLSLAKKCVIDLPQLSKLILEIPMKVSVEGGDTHGTQLQYIFKPTAMINNRIGIQHKWVRSEHYGNVALLWDAGKGKTLTWTDSTHFRNIPWGNCDNFYSILTLYHRVVFWSEDHLFFKGLNPRHMFLACPIASCICHRIVASKAPIPGVEAGDWIEIKDPIELPDLSEEEQRNADAAYEIPEALYVMKPSRHGPRFLERGLDP